MAPNLECSDDDLSKAISQSLKTGINVTEEHTEETSLLASSDGTKNDNEGRICIDNLNFLPSAASGSDPTPERSDYGSALAPYSDMNGGNQNTSGPKRNNSSASMDISKYGYDSDDTDYSNQRGSMKSYFNTKWTRVISFTCLAFVVTGLVLRSSSSPKESHNDLYVHHVHNAGFHDGSQPDPFSSLHPSRDLKIRSLTRDFSTQLHVYPNGEMSKVKDALSDGETSKTNEALPTNAWYQNLLLYPLGQDEPAPEHRAYTMPFIVDFIGPVPGLRLHQASRNGGNLVVQLIVNEWAGLTLGLSTPIGKNEEIQLSKMYGLDADSAYSPLSLNLNWKGGINDADDKEIKTNTVTKMESSIVRGMPYATMKYIFANDKDEGHDRDSHETTVLPTIVTEMPLRSGLLIDENKEITCSTDPLSNTVFEVQREIEMSFDSSDSTWTAFFSRPVNVRCVVGEKGKEFQLQVVDLVKGTAAVLTDNGSEQLIVRVALANSCTTGANPTWCEHAKPNDKEAVVAYKSLLRKHANIYPGKRVKVNYSFPKTPESDGKHGSDLKQNTTPSTARVEFDWDAQIMRSDDETSGENPTDLLMFALPHHFEQMNLNQNGNGSFCIESLLGNVCPVISSRWSLLEELDDLSFRAPRVPSHTAIPDLVKALNEDINFRMPEYFERGVGDTYFSGKILAKLGRILVIAEELMELQELQRSKEETVQISGVRKITQYLKEDEEVSKTMEALKDLVLPDEHTFLSALDHLRSGVEIWINGTAEAPFLYDEVWGGIINCGCMFNDKTWSCNNKFPNCPALSDAGLNFGNGFYNDHHFHYGYHIYAAAVVAHFDAGWGKKHFEDVLLLVRDIANPSQLDTSFPVFRHKDIYLGGSWASGIVIPPLLNGRNQESSSEAIASYESVGLYGDVMAKIWAEAKDTEKERASLHVRDVGRLLTSTELRSADRYWHVRLDDPSRQVYPKEYNEPVIGILWNCMAQFQTFFGGAAHLAYGIQLIPLTPISEKRDNYTWVQTLYPNFEKSCETNSNCDAQGWSVLGHAILATIGHKDLALKKALTVPSDAFESAGGNGHSLTNTLWYIATRPNNPPVPLPTKHYSAHSVPDGPPGGTPGGKPAEEFSGTCHCSDSCSTDVLSTDANGHSCEDRIRYLIGTGESEVDACTQISSKEFPDDCGKCNPSLCADDYVAVEKTVVSCPPCSTSVCQSDENRCPVAHAPYLCTEGNNIQGCSPVPWKLDPVQCSECCQLTEECFEN